jgi:hypothetical protein
MQRSGHFVNSSFSVRSTSACLYQCCWFNNLEVERVDFDEQDNIPNPAHSSPGAANIKGYMFVREFFSRILLVPSDSSKHFLIMFQPSSWPN